MGARPWSPEQKREHAERMREYWRTHEHPRAGQPMTVETKELQRDAQDRSRWEQRGYCKRCGGPLFSKESADLGYGPDCLVYAQEEGTITYDQYSKTVTEIENAA
jgi:uncharacterized protein DUF6011